MAIISRTVTIDAAPQKVWKVLTDQDIIRQWASAFSEGVHVETTWEPGSEVIWKDKDGTTGAKGIVTENQTAALLRVSFYDDVSSAPPQSTGEYSETYSLSGTETTTQFTIEAGPLDDTTAAQHAPLWDKAVQNIKDLSEQQ